MAKTIKTKTITLTQKQGTFTTLFHKIKGPDTKSEVELLRSLFSNEKSRILYTIKSKQPNSLYELAKLLSRDFKSVYHDIQTLEKFGFIEMIPIHKGKREKHKPVLAFDELHIKIEV